MPSRSWTFALWTLALSTNPWVSTKRWRFLPFTFLAPSYPRCSPPTPDVLTDWLSTMPALGRGFLSRRIRVRLRRAACILSQILSTRQRRK